MNKINCTDCMSHMNFVAFQKECEEAMEKLRTAILIFDASGKLCYANERARQILGKKNVFIGQMQNGFKGFMEFLYDHADDSAALTENISCIQDTTGKVMFHDTIILESGECYLVQFIENKGQNIIAELSDVTPLVAQTTHLQLLFSENSILLEAVQASQKGIIIADLSDTLKHIVFCNDALLSLIEMSREKLIGSHITDFFSAFCPEQITMLQDIIDYGGKCEVWKCIHAPDGTVKWLEIRVTATNDLANGKNLLTCFISDQTKSRLQHERLQQTQKLQAIGQLAGGIAHDFNNVLSIIDGFVRLSESGVKRGEDVTEHLQKVRRAVLRATGMTRQLLLFGKHRITENKIIDLGQLLAEVEMLLPPLLTAGICFKINCPDKPLWVDGSHDSVVQIFMNLVINARDALHGQGTITIDAHVETDQQKKKFIIVKLVDTGVGMTHEVKSKIFDPFFTTKEAGKGTGLGLTQVYALISQMNGDIRVDSAVGEGTTFTIQLPLAKAPKRIESDGRSLGLKKPLRGKTILIAEDEPELRGIMAGMVAEWGMEPICAADGIEALELQDNYEGKIDVLLTDMVMPRMGGAQMAKLFKEVRPETHIVFVSGYPEKGDIDGVDIPQGALFFAKPLESERFQNDLVNMLSGHFPQSNLMMWQG